MLKIILMPLLVVLQYYFSAFELTSEENLLFSLYIARDVYLKAFAWLQSAKKPDQPS